MADINNQVAFSVEIQQQIDAIVALQDFDYKKWGELDLQIVRAYIRNFYKNEQTGICAYCKKPVSLVSALNCHVEHIVPKSLHTDFIFTPKNLCVICADCNTIKREQETLGSIPETLENAQAVQYPRSSNSFKIVHPHFDTYNEHILIKNGFYIDRSMKGHFTIGACKLNRRLHVFGYEITEDGRIDEMIFSYLDEKDHLEKNRIFNQLRELINNQNR